MQRDKQKLINLIITVLLLLLAGISFFFVAEATASPAFHAETIAALDEKKLTVLGLTATTTVASSALSLIPGDVAAPVIEQITQLSSWLLVVLCAIYLEKILVTLTGYVAFRILIPIACLLLAAYRWLWKERLKIIAWKLTVFALVLFAMIPCSVKVSDMIDETYQLTIAQTVERAEAVQDSAETITEENGGLLNKIKEILMPDVKQLVEDAKNLVGNFIDAVAVLLITTCVIPLLVFVFFFWIVKTLFSIPFDWSNMKFFGKKKSEERREP